MLSWSLLRHVVEGLDGAADFVVAPLLHAGVQIARGKLAQSRGKLLDGSADAVRQVDQQRQREQPDRRDRQQDIDELDAAPQVVLFDEIDQVAGVA